MHFPQPDKIEKLAQALNLDVKELFDFEHFQKKNELIEFIDSTLKILN